MSNTINNPVTGERIKFLEHPGEIDLLAMEFTIAPQGLRQLDFRWDRAR